jgi:hypothetical protein
MNKKLLIPIILVIFAVLAGTLVYTALELPEEGEEYGYIDVLSRGRAGDYGYYIYNVNGSGEISLLALNEEPKSRIVVLSESGIGMDSFSEFITSLEELEEYGMTIEIVGRSDARNVRGAIFVVPTGAIPDYVLDTLDATGTFNTLVYIGKTDLKMSSSLRKDYWYTQLDDESKEKIIVWEHTLDEFMDTPRMMEQFKGELLNNSWAGVGSTGRILEGADGEGSIFVPLEESGYLRLTYSIGERKGIDDSPLLPLEPVEMETDGDVYPWERAAVSFTLGNTTGKAFYTVEKNGEILLSEDLGRVGVEKAFYYTYEFEEPGDYIVKVYDSSGMLGSTYVHVKDIEITREGTWDIRTVFGIKVDGEPLKTGDLYISVNGAEEERYPITDGAVAIPVKLQGGQNVFRVRYLEYKEDIVFEREKEGTLEIYLKYGPFIAAFLVVVYVLASMRRKPTYTLKIEMGARKERNVLEVTPAEITECISNIEERFGWGKVPVTLSELGYEIRRHITDGADILEGDLEMILRSLEKRGVVERYGDYYQLAGWGDVRKNVLMRQVRDLLVKNGVKFREGKKGMELESFIISVDYFESPRKLVLVFDGEEDLRKFMRGLKGAEKAGIEIKKSNDRVVLTTIGQLEEIL